MMMDRANLTDWVVDKALIAGANECAVTLTNQRQVSVEMREHLTEKLEESVQNSLSLSLYVDGRFSSHSTNDLRTDALDAFIREAVVTTRYLTPDPYRELPDPKLYPVNMDRDLDVLDNSYNEIETVSRIDIAQRIEDAALAVSDQIISATTGYSDVYYQIIRRHSNGFSGEITATLFDFGAEVTVKDPDGGRPSDWARAVSRHRHDLPDPAEIGRQAAERALRKIGQGKIASGSYDMIVENRSAGKLVSMLLGPMSARALQQKSSWLEDMLGKTVAPDFFTIHDEPFIERGLGSRLFDYEGLAVNRRVLIDKGVLSEYLVDNYYGKKLGMTPNSGATTNLLFDYGCESAKEMIAGMGKAILITGFLGGNYNATTGDFSFGIVGYLIENGEYARPVNEMNISGNARELWRQLIKMGNDPYLYSSNRVPSMVFHDIQFSGI